MAPFLRRWRADESSTVTGFDGRGLLVTGAGEQLRMLLLRLRRAALGSVEVGAGEGHRSNGLRSPTSKLLPVASFTTVLRPLDPFPPAGLACFAGAGERLRSAGERLRIIVLR
mmetsp:Transcript_12034/g.21167  ORF Transcript_12034/g.21167 Transcript_12034/m.21167 type:complete len:113 (-) Transcript_12034:373-711(-)